MNGHKHIIVINGRHYNAMTGENLSHPADHAAKTEPATHKTQPHQAAAHKANPKTAARHKAHHITAHAPKRTETLMRHSVKKPPASLKRHIRVQGHLGSQGEPIRVATKRTALSHRSGHGHKSPGGRIIISHFSPDLFTTVRHVPVDRPEPSDTPHEPSEPTMKPAFAGTSKTAHRSVLKEAHKRPLTTAELLDYVVQSANMPFEDLHEHKRHKKPRKLLKRPGHAHSHAAAAR